MLAVEMVDKFVNMELDMLFKNKNEQLHKFLTNHERKQLLIKNLKKEIKLLELNPKIKLTEKHVIEICIDFARMFAKRAIAVKENEIKSDLSRMIERAANEARVRNEELDQIIEGDAIEVNR